MLSWSYWITAAIAIALVVLILLVFFGALRSSEATEYQRTFPHRRRIKAVKGEPPDPLHVPVDLPWYQAPTTSAADRVRQFVKRTFKQGQ